MKNTITAVTVISVLALGLVKMGFSETKVKPDSEHQHPAGTSNVKEFRIVAIEYEGTKVWVPGTLILKKGEKAKVMLINNIKSDPNTHGFAIDEFGVKVVVERGKPETVEFTANKDGLFTIYCQLHPAHIGGQLLVLR